LRGFRRTLRGHLVVYEQTIFETRALRIAAVLGLIAAAYLAYAGLGGPWPA